MAAVDELVQVLAQEWVAWSYDLEVTQRQHPVQVHLRHHHLLVATLAWRLEQEQEQALRAVGCSVGSERSSHQIQHRATGLETESACPRTCNLLIQVHNHRLCTRCTLVFALLLLNMDISKATKDSKVQNIGHFAISKFHRHGPVRSADWLTIIDMDSGFDSKLPEAFR